MLNQKALEVIERSWVQLNAIDSRLSMIKPCYFINTFTKEVKNLDTGAILSTSDNGLSVYPRPYYEFVKINGKTSSFTVEKLRNIMRANGLI